MSQYCSLTGFCVTVNCGFKRMDHSLYFFIPYIALTQFMALLDVTHFSIAFLTVLLPGFALLQTVVSKRNVNVCK